MNEQLIQLLKGLLSDTIALKYKAHGYHWNVEGEDFPQYHSKFEDIYEDYDSAIDPLAEWIRMLGDYAPFKLSRFASLSSIPESQVTSEAEDMAKDLKMSNDMMIVKFAVAAEIATNAKQFGLANFFGDRQTMHQKWSWQLGACISEDVMETPAQEALEPESPTVTE
jgi:starvation-inducible DNA-binding protein